MRKIKRRIAKRNLFLMLALLVFCVSFSLIYLSTGYSMMENPEKIESIEKININPLFSAENKTLNPDWVKYNSATPEEKATYDLVPDMYLEEQQVLDLRNVYDRTDQEYGASATDSSYSLKNEKLTLQNRNQGGSGLCWAFAALSTVESAMLRNGLHTYSNPDRLSVRQMDYATVHPDYITEGYNPYFQTNRTQLYVSGGYTSAPYGLLESGVSPVSEDVFGEWNSDTSVKSLDDVINVNNSKYFVSDIAMYGAQAASKGRTGTNSYIMKLKDHVIKYGEVAIGTIGPESYYGGSCVYTDASGDILINDLGSCNSSAGDDNNGHAMVIIGWDDNYSYSYCKNTSSTTSSLSGCSSSNVITGKGAFILKNSWGSSVTNPYIAYSSAINFAYGTIEVEERDWDVNYDATKQRYGATIAANTYEVTYGKGRQNEILETITWNTTVIADTYTIYAKSGEGAYVRVAEGVNRGIAGTFSVDVGDFELDDNDFSIKIVTRLGTINDIKAFTSYASETNAIGIDTVVPTTIQAYNKSFDIYTQTRNIPTGSKISYSVVADNGVSLAGIMSFGNLFNVNGQVNSTVTLSKTLSTTGFTIKTFYNGTLYDTDYVSVASANGYWDSGTGTSADPFIIKDAEDFKNIFVDKIYLGAYFKLANDIDFNGVTYDPASAVGPFSGTLDGDNHLIINLDVTSKIGSLIHEVNNGTVKNLGINNCSFKNTSGYYAGVVAATALNGSFENIVVGPATTIDGVYEYSGGIVGYAIESGFTNVANYADVVNDSSATNSYSGGIVGYAEGSYFTQIYNEGNIVSYAPISGGIAGGLVLQNNSSDYNDLEYVYNKGDITSNGVHGGFFGYDFGSSLNYAYSITSKNSSVTNFGNIAGTAEKSTYYNVYYVKTGHSAVVTSSELSTGGLYVKTLAEMKSSATYSKFDFTNRWFMHRDYPAFKTFYIKFIESITAVDLTVNKGYSANIEYSLSPTNVYFDNLQFISSNEAVATVNTTGLVTGVGKGETTITIKSLDGGNLTKSIKVVVTDVELDFGDLNVDHNRNYILDIESGTKVSEITSEITTKGNLTIFDKNAKRLASNANVTTASKVAITINGTTYFYTIIVSGDVTGDGLIKMSDVMKIANHLFDANIITGGAYLEAADVTGDGLIKMSDVMKVANSLFEK